MWGIDPQGSSKRSIFSGHDPILDRDPLIKARDQILDRDPFIKDRDQILDRIWIDYGSLRN